MEIRWRLQVVRHESAPRLAIDRRHRPPPTPSGSSSEEVGAVAGIGRHGGEPLLGGCRQPELDGVIALTTASVAPRCHPFDSVSKILTSWPLAAAVCGTKVTGRLRDRG